MQHAPGLFLYHIHVTVCPANQHPKNTTKKEKPTNLCAPREFLRNVSAMFDNHTILLFRL